MDTIHALLKRLEGLRAATAGRWTASMKSMVRNEQDELVLHALGYDERERTANRDFAVAAHAAIPELLEAMRARDAEIARLRAALAPFADADTRMPDWLEPETPLSSRVRYGTPPRFFCEGLTLANLRVASAVMKGPE